MEELKEIQKLVEEKKEIAKKSVLDCKLEIKQLARSLKHLREFFVEKMAACDYSDVVEWLERETEFSTLMQEVNLIYTLHEYEKNEEQEKFYQEFCQRKIDNELFQILNI